MPDQIDRAIKASGQMQQRWQGTITLLPGRVAGLDIPLDISVAEAWTLVGAVMQACEQAAKHQAAQGTQLVLPRPQLIRPA